MTAVRPAPVEDRKGQAKPKALATRVARVCLGSALALTVSVALLLLFAIGTLAQWGGGEA